MSRRSARVAANAEKVEKDKRFMELVTSPTESGLRVIDAGAKGRGVAADKEYATGDYVAKYLGELVSHKEALERYEYDISCAQILCFCQFVTFLLMTH